MMKKILFFLFFVTFFSACNVATSSSAPVETSVPAPTLTTTPIFTPTSDLWKIQQCRKAPNVMSDQSFLILNYTGDIDGHGKIDMLLNFTEKNEILGFAFDFEKVREYKLMGCIEERKFIMWLQQDGAVAAVVQGEFAKSDPRHQFSSSTDLSYEVITGSLIEKNAVNNPLYLRFVSAGGGTMEHRFYSMRVDDDTIILNAVRQFLAAVVHDDRDQVVKMLHFPIQVGIGGDEKALKTADEFLASYPTIFGNGFKERLAMTFQNDLVAYTGKNYDVILLSVYGGGQIGFDAEGKITSIVNLQDEIFTSTAIPNDRR